MKLVPLGDKLVVKRLEPEETTAGGIILPESAQQRPQQGRVLSVGDGAALAGGGRARPQVQEGDRVLFASYAGSEISIGDDTVLVLSESEVLAVID